MKRQRSSKAPEEGGLQTAAEPARKLARQEAQQSVTLHTPRSSIHSDQSPEPEHAQRLPRQPQTSCGSCRQKKLKCDRGRPCSNCRSRGIKCSGGEGGWGSLPPPAYANSEINSLETSRILERLERLEKIVLRTRRHGDEDGPSDGQSDVSRFNSRAQPSLHSARFSNPPTPAPTRVIEQQMPQPGDVMDYPYAGDCMLTESRDGLMYMIDLPFGESAFNKEEATTRTILMPCQEDAMVLLEHFLCSSFSFLHIVYPPSMRALFPKFYADTDFGFTGHPAGTRTVHAALILGICATSAFSWDKDANGSCPVFKNEQHAARQSGIWLKATMDLLDQARRSPLYACLEEVQANMILSDLLYNMEGCSARSRYVHNNALAVARDISLHLTDHPAQNTKHDAVTSEIKRRVWWHLISTNWLLGMMGGSQDRTYSVHPNHMIVDRPRNINDADLPHMIVKPDEIPTDMTYFILRCRLAELSRKIIDALPLSSSENITDLSGNEILAIATLFEETLQSIPSCFVVGSPLPDGAPPTADVQRRVMHMAIHARRARLFRPFLLLDYRPPANKPLLQFQELCLRSARKVLQLGCSLLRDSIDPSPNDKKPAPGQKHIGPHPLAHRSGTVICHLFMACVVLITDPDMRHKKDTPEVQQQRIALQEAQHLLGLAEKECSVAAGLVKKLLAILNKHRTKRAVEEDNASAESATVYGETISAAQRTPVQGPPTQQQERGGYIHGHSGDQDHHPPLSVVNQEFMFPRHPDELSAAPQYSYGPQAYLPPQPPGVAVPLYKDGDNAAAYGYQQGDNYIDWEAIAASWGDIDQDYACLQVFAEMDAVFAPM
ncbi:hypothetical protein B0H63DRAFT_519900 [Podospora didyma]|uniref:Zn(2)-C6 fungal-type domain-containing protein n=1 Tax=Podospora didyma TaxID=330526 RepID=A0AAE0NZQ3_9PEZI|nr:hypothetical protein B0H63DRAFT_519900 [Podospora didyma]